MQKYQIYNRFQILKGTEPTTYEQEGVVVKRTTTKIYCDTCKNHGLVGLKCRAGKPGFFKNCDKFEARMRYVN